MEDDSDKESYISKKKQKQTQLIQEYNLRPSAVSEEEEQKDYPFVHRPFNNTSWQQIQREIIALTSKRKQDEAIDRETISVCITDLNKLVVLIAFHITECVCTKCRNCSNFA